MFEAKELMLHPMGEKNSSREMPIALKIEKMPRAAPSW
jgi:hypothetical protein